MKILMNNGSESMEVWKDVVGYEGLYQVSNLGRVKSVERYKDNNGTKQLVKERILKQGENKKGGYLKVDLWKNNKSKTLYVHRLVAIAFIDNPTNKPTVNHIDGNHKNNHVSNLEWATQKEQNEHIYKTNLKDKESIDKTIKAMNEANSKSIICIETGETFISIAQAERELNIKGIGAVCRGKRKSCGGLHFKFN